MAIETGIENEGLQNKEEGPSNQELLNIVRSLSTELQALKQHGLPQAMPTTNFSKEDIIKIATEIGRRNNPVDDGYEAEEERDADDYDAKGQAFFSFFVGYVIADDRRKGQPVRAPYKETVFFDYSHEVRSGHGRYANITATSVYISHSKKITKWLEEHSQFNAMFFKNSKDLQDIDVFKANKVAKYLTALQSMDLHQVVEKCKHEQVGVTDDINVMRSKLAHKWANDEIVAEDQVNRTRTLQADFEKKHPTMMKGAGM